MSKDVWIDLNTPCPKCKQMTLKGHMSPVRGAHSSTGKGAVGLRKVVCNNCSYTELPKGNNHD